MDRFRYESFHTLAYTVLAEKSLPLPESTAARFKQQIIDDTEEHIIIRACAAYLLAHHYEHLHETGEAYNTFGRAIEICQSREAIENRKLRLPWPSEEKEDADENETCPASSTFDDIVQISSSHRRFIEDPKEELIRIFSSSTNASRHLGQPEVIDEMLSAKFIEMFWDPFKLLNDPPTLTTTLFAQIKALPEVDKTFLVIKDDLPPKEPIQYDKSGEQDPVLQRSKTQDNYRVLEIKEDSFHLRGKIPHSISHPVFCLVNAILCDKKSSHQKNLLAAFAVACQHPYNLMPGAVAQSNRKRLSSPLRPKKVLLASSMEAEHPQIKLFLSMMGCQDIEVADPNLLQFLKQEKYSSPADEQMLNRTFTKKEFPCFYDLSRRKMCGNCSRVGPSLKKCPCGSAYYCSDECQKAQWKAHKKEHKAEIKKF